MKKKHEEEEFEERWDKKRIGFALVLLIFIFAGLAYFLNGTFNFSKQRETKVLSVKDEKLEDIVQEQILNLKKQAADINVDEIASSSPEVRNLIEDLKALGNLPKNEAKQACLKVCNNF